MMRTSHVDVQFLASAKSWFLHLWDVAHLMHFCLKEVCLECGYLRGREPVEYNNVFIL